MSCPTDQSIQYATAPDLVGLIVQRMANAGMTPATILAQLLAADMGPDGIMHVTGAADRVFSLELAETEALGRDRSHTSRARAGAITVQTRAVVRWCEPLQLDGGIDSYSQALTHEQQVVAALIAPDPVSTARVLLSRVSRDVLESMWMVVTCELTIEHPYSIR